jgi:hypothetical protein
MTLFERNGYWRTRANGKSHWVSGSLVARDDWDRHSTSGNRSGYFERLADNRAVRSATARFVNPNADCPVCGEPVFFYQNHSGSRVYFDELGPPWPKHPCTDQEAYTRSPESSVNTIVQPSGREVSQVELIDNWQLLAGIDTQYTFRNKYKIRKWSAWQVVGRFRGANGALLVLNSVDTAKQRRQYFSTRNLPKSFAIQTLAFVNRGRLTYFDHATMEPVEVEIQRIVSASGFVEELIKKRARSKARF